jgi:hypothetical protein
MPRVFPVSYKIQNPALRLSGVTGFLGDRGSFQILLFLLGLKEETWFGNTPEYCLYLTPLKVNGSGSLDALNPLIPPSP